MGHPVTANRAFIRVGAEDSSQTCLSFPSF